MRKLVYGLIILLLILRHDFWWWDSAYLVFGFVPIGLFYQAMISLAAGVLWALAVKYCWPKGLDEEDDAIATADGKGEHA